MSLKKVVNKYSNSSGEDISQKKTSNPQGYEKKKNTENEKWDKEKYQDRRGNKYKDQNYRKAQSKREYEDRKGDRVNNKKKSFQESEFEKQPKKFIEVDGQLFQLKPSELEDVQRQKTRQQRPSRRNKHQSYQNQPNSEVHEGKEYRKREQRGQRGGRGRGRNQAEKRVQQNNISAISGSSEGEQNFFKFQRGERRHKGGQKGDRGGRGRGGRRFEGDNQVQGEKWNQKRNVQKQKNYHGNQERKDPLNSRNGHKFDENDFRKPRKDNNRREYNQDKKNMSQKQAPKKLEVEEKEIPDSLLCPISQELMGNPMMITVCGHTFEGALITQWLKKEGKCPVCKKVADIQKLQKNFALADLASHYK